MNHEDVDKILIIARKEVQQSRSVILREIVARRVHNVMTMDGGTLSFIEVKSVIDSSWDDLEKTMIKLKVRGIVSDIYGLVKYSRMERLNIQGYMLSLCGVILSATMPDTRIAKLLRKESFDDRVDEFDSSH